MRLAARLATAISMALIALAIGGVASAFATPTVTSVSPNSGPTGGGTKVTIKGTEFAAGTTVKFASTAATEVVIGSSTSLTALSPKGTGTIDVTVTNTKGTSATNPHDWFAYEAPTTGHWLGLNGNAVSNKFDGEWLGPVNEFSKEGILWDRDFEYTAGEVPSEGEKDSEGTPWNEVGLKLDHENNMIPLSVVEYKGYEGEFKSDPFFPTATRTTKEKEEGKTTVKEYAEGFVKSATAYLKEINEKYPGMPMYFEPMNEPWGYTTPQYDGTEYAPVASEVLTKAKEAGIPLTDIYVAGIGADLLVKEGKEEWYSPGWIPAMYKAVPSLETEVKGWYFHPYGPPTGSEFNNSDGIQSLPEVRKSIKSGSGNLIVSEVGYCALEVGACGGNPQVKTGAEAAKLLKEMLTNALPYREAGWLKALVVYSRNDGGWAMQELPSMALSPSGKALDEFAAAHG
jgi:hypothetical protein